MPRPVRADVVAAYDLGVEGYVSTWSGVILGPARDVVAALEIAPGALVLDVGAGSGALVPSIREAAPGVSAVALDASVAMLGAARSRTGAVVARADAMALPVRSGVADAVLLAYVLFHLSQPAQAVAEAARVLRTGGRAGTVTWSWEASFPAEALWLETLASAGAPTLPPRRSDRGLDSPEAVGALLEGAGLRPLRVWRQRLHRQWTPESYWSLVTGSGLTRLRLRALDGEARAETLRRAHELLSGLAPEDLQWSGEVICAVAERTGNP